MEEEGNTEAHGIHGHQAIGGNLLLIFIRNPELGKCKTRLAAKIGERSALAIYKFLLRHTESITKGLQVAKAVYYSEYIGEDTLWDPRFFTKKIQEGTNLGERMANAFRHGFDAGFDRIVIIGSDMYDLAEEDINQAFQALKTHEYAIGPAEDGGYYLLGMTRFTPALFHGKQWGTPTVLEKTLQELPEGNTKVLPLKNDIDTYEDIKDLEPFRPFLKHLES